MAVGKGGSDPHPRPKGTRLPARERGSPGTNPANIPGAVG